MTAGQLVEIPIKDLNVSKTKSQVARRKRFNKTSLHELAESIGEQGVLQNIIVRQNGTGLEIVAGERRYLAAELAGLETIPGIVRELSDEEVIEIQLIENLQREDVHPMEEAEGYEQLMQQHNHPIEDIYSRVGKSRSYVYGRLKLLSLCAVARKAFYDGKINASIALLLARIPGKQLQHRALKDFTDYRGDISFRRAKQVVHEHYMLRLRSAPFPTGDEKLIPKAGACRTCPKRTGNQPELFGDVKGADVCTDPVCFQAKVKAHGKQVIKAAAASGQKVLAGKDAKAVAPHGIEYHIRGFTKLSSKSWVDGKQRSTRSLLDNDVATTLLQDHKTGEVIEVVPDSVVNAAIRKLEPKRSHSTNSVDVARRRKAKIEKEYRAELYNRLRPKLPAPTLHELAHALVDRLEHDYLKVLCKLREFDPPRVKGYGGGSGYQKFDAIADTIDGLSKADVVTFINDCLYVRELQVSSWSISKPEKLLAAAKEHGVNAASVKRSVTARVAKKKTKKSKKKTAKKARKKKKTTRTR